MVVDGGEIVFMDKSADGANKAIWRSELRATSIAQ